MLDTFKAVPDEKWGRLVKSWATGKNQIDPDQDPIPVPVTLDELRDTCALYDIVLTIPARVTNEMIDWHVATVDSLSIRLPPKQLVEEFEEALRDGDEYFLQEFYSIAFSGAPLSLPTPDDRSTFQANRIGDYSVGMCA